MLDFKTKLDKFNKAFTQLRFDQGFRDGTQIWITGTPSDGSIFEYHFSEYDNLSGKFTTRMESGEFGGGFIRQPAVDDDFNMYVASTEGPLYKINYFDFSLEQKLSNIDNSTRGIAVDSTLKELYLFMSSPAQVEIYDLDSFAFKESRPAIIESSNTRYITVGDRVYWAQDASNQLIIHWFNKSTRATGQTPDLLADTTKNNVPTRPFFINDSDMYTVFPKTLANDSFYLRKYSVGDWQLQWEFPIPFTFEVVTADPITTVDFDKNVYLNTGDGGSAGITAIKENPLGDPELLFQNLGYVTSSNLNVGIDFLQVEKEKTGFLFTLHGAGANISVLDKLTGQVLQLGQNAPPRDNYMIIIPKTDSPQVGFRNMLMSAVDWETDIPGSDDIVRPASGYQPSNLSFDEPFVINEFDNKKYLRLAFIRAFAQRFDSGAGFETIDLTLEVVKEFTDSTPDEVISTIGTISQSLVFDPAQTREEDYRIDKIVDLTNVNRIFLRVTENFATDFLPDDIFKLTVYADFDF